MVELTALDTGQLSFPAPRVPVCELVHHGLQKWVFDDRVPPGDFATFDKWRSATQVYQAELLRHHIELLRRLKYRPVGGFCMFALNDPAPVVSWSVLDHQRVPKLGWRALQDACAPVIVVADRPPDIVSPGQALELRRQLAQGVVLGQGAGATREPPGEVGQQFAAV